MRTHLFAAATLVATLSLASCASPGYDQDTAQGLREHIVAIGEASAAGDWQAALDGLEVMAAELAEARRLGKVDDERFDTITLAMERVRLDLEVAIAAAATEAEQQRLLEEQARLQEQISQLQNQGGGGENERGDDKSKNDKSKNDKSKNDKSKKDEQKGEGERDDEPEGKDGRSGENGKDKGDDDD